MSQSDPVNPSGKKGSSKIRLLAIGFGIGAVVGLAYIYKSLKQKVVPLANLESDKIPLLLEPPPIDLIAKKVKLLDSKFVDRFIEIYDC